MICNSKTTKAEPPQIHFFYRFDKLKLGWRLLTSFITKTIIMKRLLSILFVSGFLAACGGNDKKVSVTTKNEDGSTTKTEVDVKGMQTTVDETEKKMEELKKLTPMTLEELKALLPEELNGVKQSNYNSSTMMGYAFASADYKKDDRTSLKLALYDCAGEAGSAWYGLAYWSKMSFQQESSTEYTKSIDWMGKKAVEHYNKENNRSELTFAANDRLLIVLTGENMKPEELREAAKKLNVKIS